MVQNINLANLLTSQGIKIFGASANDNAGFTIKNAGDVNGDGNDDIIIGAPGALNSAGITYVIFGRKNLNNINLATDLTINGVGFYITGCTAGDRSGLVISGAVDFNQDGYDDIFISAPNAYSKAGATYLVYGKKTGFTNVDVCSCTVFVGCSANDYTGVAMNAVKDINGDGYDDLIIGAPNAWNYAGGVYVVFGKQNYPQTNSLCNKYDVLFLGEYQGAYFGQSVSDAGDLNKDGLSDIMIGSSWLSPNGRSQAGKVYMIFGSANFQSFSVANLVQPFGFSIYGSNSHDHLGEGNQPIQKMGDFNNDGNIDIIVGAWKADPYGRVDAGTTYLIFGKHNYDNIDLALLTVEEGFLVNGINSEDHVGFFISGIGDVNGDGYDDFVTSSDNNDNARGASYVIFGKSNGFSNVNLANLNLLQGFTIYGENLGDRAGYGISGNCDFNKDGVSDILIGAPGANLGRGISYIIFGSISPTLLPTSSPTIIPTKYPTIFPTTSNPTLKPTFLPSAPTVFPTLIPSLDPTISPTFYPSTQPTTQFPTLNPTFTPTNSPTFKPTALYSNVINIDVGGTYYGTPGSDNFIINSLFPVNINAGMGIDRFTILPNKDVIYVINDFDSTSEQIDLSAFTSLRSIRDLYITFGSAVINLPNNQKVKLLNYAPSDISPNNFIFSFETKADNGSGNSLISYILGTSLGSIGVLGAGVLWFSKQICTSAFNRWSPDEAKTLPGVSIANIILYPCNKFHSKAYLDEKIADHNREKEIEKINSAKKYSTSTIVPINNNKKVFLCIDAMMDPENVKLQNEEFARFGKHLTSFISEDLPENIKWLMTSTQFKLEQLFIKDAAKKTQAVVIYQGSSSADDMQFDPSDNAILSLLNAKQILYNLPLIHYVAQNILNYLGYNITLPNPSDNKALLVSLDLVLGNMAAQYLPAESVMNGMFFSTASSISFAVRLTAVDYLKNQEVSDEPIEFAQQCGMTIAAHSLPSIINYAFTKAYLPNSEMSVSTLDMLATSSFGVIQCYNNYKAAYGIEAASSTLNTVAPYIADALTLWTLKNYMVFDTSSVGSLTVSIKNAISVAATIYAAHCVSDVAMDFIPQEVQEYIEPVANYIQETYENSMFQIVSSASDYLDIQQ